MTESEIKKLIKKIRRSYNREATNTYGSFEDGFRSSYCRQKADACTEILAAIRKGNKK